MIIRLPEKRKMYWFYNNVFLCMLSCFRLYTIVQKSYSASLKCNLVDILEILFFSILDSFSKHKDKIPKK